jgi:hypothetical protein
MSFPKGIISLVAAVFSPGEKIEAVGVCGFREGISPPAPLLRAPLLDRQ